MTTKTHCPTCISYTPTSHGLGACDALSRPLHGLKIGDSVPDSIVIRDGKLTRREVDGTLGRTCFYWCDAKDPMPDEFYKIAGLGPYEPEPEA